MLEGKVRGNESRSSHVIRPFCVENCVKTIKYSIKRDIVLGQTRSSDQE
jgi:hypothetical protein